MADNTDIKLPLYMELKNRLLEAFSDMEYYTTIPSERELCEQFGVSRPTVRKALELLEKEQIVIRMQGKCSFFMGNKVHVDSSKSTGIAFYNEVISKGQYTRSKILTQNLENASKPIALRLGIDENEKIFHLERLRYIEDELYSLANSFISIKLCPELLKFDFTNISLFKMLEEHGVHPYRADKVLEIKQANEYDVIHLGLNLKDPVSVMQTITYDKQGQVLEYAISRSLAYKTRYEMTAYNNSKE